MGEGPDVGLLKSLQRWAGQIVAATPEAPVLLVGGDDTVHVALAGYWDDITRAELSPDGAVLPFDDNAFAVVVALDVLAGATDPEGTLAELRRVSREHVITAGPRHVASRVANLLRGRHVGSLGNDPDLRNQWSTPEFLRMASRYGGLRDSELPLGWTAAWIVPN